MESRTLIRGIGLTRVVLGTGCIAFPRAMRIWIGKDARGHGTQALTMGFGAREIALGGGVLHALATGGDARPWVTAATVADGGDFLATLRGKGHLPKSGFTAFALSAGWAAAAGLWLARQDDW